MSDLTERLRAYDPTAKLVDRLREHDLAAYPEDGDWQDHYCDRADDLLKEAADRIAALEAEAPGGKRGGLERVTADALALSCDDQFTLATNLASNIGYELTEEPLHPDTPKPGAFEAMVERALIPEAPAREGWRPIETAPRDGTVVWVWCPAYEDLDALTSLASWHEDAGWCVDELRTPTHWHLLPPSPPQDHREGE